MADNLLADACAAWQSSRDEGSTPIRAAARVLTGVPHYFRTPYIEQLDQLATSDAPALARARVLIEAITRSTPRDVGAWRAEVGLSGRDIASRGLRANPGADEQIEQLVRSPGARITMPLWGFSLSEETALGFGTRFLFRLHGEFRAVAAWVHSGIKDSEQELIGSGIYRVRHTSQSGETTVVDLEQESHLPLLLLR